jgi:hypothetical protein
LTAAEMVGSLYRRGILLVPAPDGSLRVRPRTALSGAERSDLVRHRAAIVALLEADPVGWRAAVMATQATQNGAIPLLLARPGTRFPPESCCSCGDRLAPSDRYRCGPCVSAVLRVLEGVG